MIFLLLSRSDIILFFSWQNICVNAQETKNSQTRKKELEVAGAAQLLWFLDVRKIEYKMYCRAQETNFP